MLIKALWCIWRQYKNDSENRETVPLETTLKKKKKVVVGGTLPFYFFTDDLIEEKKALPGLM